MKRGEAGVTAVRVDSHCQNVEVPLTDPGYLRIKLNVDVSCNKYEKELTKNASFMELLGDRNASCGTGDKTTSPFECINCSHWCPITFKSLKDI